MSGARRLRYPGPMRSGLCSMHIASSSKRIPFIYAATVPTPPRTDRRIERGRGPAGGYAFSPALRYYDLRGSQGDIALQGLRSLVHGFVSLESSGALKHPVKSRNDSFAHTLVRSFLAALLSKKWLYDRAQKGQQGCERGINGAASQVARPTRHDYCTWRV